LAVCELTGSLDIDDYTLIKAIAADLPFLDMKFAKSGKQRWDKIFSSNFNTASKFMEIKNLVG